MDHLGKGCKMTRKELGGRTWRTLCDSLLSQGPYYWAMLTFPPPNHCDFYHSLKTFGKMLMVFFSSRSPLLLWMTSVFIWTALPMSKPLHSSTSSFLLSSHPQATLFHSHTLGLHITLNCATLKITLLSSASLLPSHFPVCLFNCSHENCSSISWNVQSAYPLNFPHFISPLLSHFFMIQPRVYSLSFQYHGN